MQVGPTVAPPEVRLKPTRPKRRGNPSPTPPQRSPSEPTAPPSGSVREDVFNTLKGIGIVEVMLHHSMGHGARKFAESGAFEWWFYRGINRVLHFAVPLFLLVSSFLLTRSLLKRQDWRGFMDRRIHRTLQPYLLWSLFYWGVRLLFVRAEGDVYFVSRTYPVIGTLTGPNLLVNFSQHLSDLITGKAFYHLYFMVVLLQLAVLLPLMIWILKGRNLSFPAVALGVGVCQVLVFVAQRYVVQLPSPGATIFWYLPSMVFGVWIALDPARWQDSWRRFGPYLAGFALVISGIYLAVEYRIAQGIRTDFVLHNSLFAGYAIGISLLLFGFGRQIARTKFGRWMAHMGAISLPMFLVHPLLLVLLSGPTIGGLIGRLPLPALWSGAMVILLSYAFALITARLGVDRFLFGQRLPLGRNASASPAASSI